MMMMIELISRLGIHPVLTIDFFPLFFKDRLVDCLMGSKIESIQDWDSPKQDGDPKRESPIESFWSGICFSTDLAGIS